MKEADIMRQLMIRLTSFGCRVFRNNVGKAWVGQDTNLGAGKVIIENARRFHAGLCEGSSDIIGWHTVEITPEMVGKKLAVFTAVEVKSKRGAERDKQKSFRKMVEESGGFGFVARSEEECLEKLQKSLILLKE